MTYKWHNFIIVIFLTFASAAFGQSDMVNIGVFVRDETTHATLNTADITIMNTDSTNVLINKPYLQEVIKGSNLYRYLCTVPRYGRYIIKVVCKGYDTECVDIELKNNEKQKIVDAVILHRSAIQLEEVTIVGSRILMIMKGDTLVYNASVLQLTNGSMLDALIRQLPGVELLKDGRITMNGSYVSSLLVNGRNFFKGDAKVALDNLPAYYVDKVKVYHESSKLWRYQQCDSARATELDPLIMDVQLKRQYAQGWIGSAEGGYGSKDRYLTRLFGMLYTKHFGLFIFSNINNLNNIQEANKNGHWADEALREGIGSAKTFGLNFTGTDKSSLMKYDTSLKLSFLKQEKNEIFSLDRFFASGNIFERGRIQDNNSQTTIDWKGSWNYLENRFYIQFNPSVSYKKEKRFSIGNNVTFTSDPEDSYKGASIDSIFSPLGSSRLSSLLINMRRLDTQEDLNEFKMDATLETGYKLGGRWLEIKMKGNYLSEREKQYKLDVLKYGIANEKNSSFLQNRYTKIPSMQYDYSVSTKYNLFSRPNNKWIIMDVQYKYNQKFLSRERQLYHLEQYEGYKNKTGALPSTIDSLQAAIDIKNSYFTTSLERMHTLLLDFHLKYLQVILPISWSDSRISDLRNEEQKDFNRHKPCTDVVLFFYKNGFTARYNYQTELPPLNYMLSVRDDSDPLYVSLGNPNLKTIKQHTVNFLYRKNKTEQQRQLNVSYYWSMIQDAVCMGRLYDTGTGITTTLPQNINGNWNTRLRLSFSQAVDNALHLCISTVSEARLRHSVDYASIITDGDKVLSESRNSVNNITLGETFKGDYRLNGWNLGLNIHAEWNQIHSFNSVFSDINAWHYNYGLTFAKSILKRIELDSDITMWSRRGYRDPAMNDDQLIWNASVSYSIDKLARWIVRLKACDLLHQVNAVRQSTNVQGRTETWYRTIPSYMMLSLVYQFKKAPLK